MNALIVSILIFTLIWEIENVAPGLIKKCWDAFIAWNKYCFEPMEVSK